MTAPKHTPKRGEGPGPVVSQLDQKLMAFVHFDHNGTAAKIRLERARPAGIRLVIEYFPPWPIVIDATFGPETIMRGARAAADALFAATDRGEW